MVAYGRSVDPQSAAQSQAGAQGTRVRGAAAPEAPASRLPVSVVTLLASIGVLIACVAYADGRLGHAATPTANRLYWLGQAFVLIPIAVRLLSRRRISNREIITLIVALTVAEYILKICYSPLQFTFQDEFLHWRGTANLLQTGNPYSPNFDLPVAAGYPGLELVTAALISCTGLSIFTAGAIVIGVAHLLFIFTLYWVFSTIGRSQRIGGIAILLYYTTPSLTSFNSEFVYESLALAFLGITVLATVKVTVEKSRNDRIRWYVLAILGIMGTIITHHVTSYMMTGTLILAAVASWISGSGRTAARVAILAIISTVAVVAWVALAARETINYFTPTVNGLVNGLSGLLGSGSTGAPSTSSAPLGNQLLEGVGILVIGALVLIGVWHVWRRYRYQPWILTMAIGCLAWFGDLAIRVGTPNGQELAGRSATYVDIPVALIATLALTKLVNLRSLRRVASAVMAIIAALVVILQFDGLANGWPPYWERLPGPFQVGGVDRAVEPEVVSAGNWTLSALGPGNEFATDFGSFSVISGYGGQNALFSSVAFLYTSPTYTPAIAAEVATQNIHYVLVDRRLSQSLPVGGAYFMGDTSKYKKPIPLADLTKFDHAPGVPRIYDSGNIVIYNLQGPGYAQK